MSNGEVCCRAGVCCPPEEQVAALVEMLLEDGHVTERTQAEQIVRAMLTHVDVAPKGFTKMMRKAAGHHD
jgi:hypothetical protein